VDLGIKVTATVRSHHKFGPSDGEALLGAADQQFASRVPRTKRYSRDVQQRTTPQQSRRAHEAVASLKLPLAPRPRHTRRVPPERPLLLLDVDGVLNPFAGDVCPATYQEYPFFPDEEPVRLCHAHADWLQELASRFEIVWATGWGEEANRLIAPVLQLPQLPVIPFPPIPFEPREKVPAIAVYVGSRPTVWIDDALTPEGYAWASTRESPTLLINVDPAEGLTRAAVEQSLRWAHRVTPA
jgi:hypothetical protein